MASTVLQSIMEEHDPAVFTLPALSEQEAFYQEWIDSFWKFVSELTSSLPLPDNVPINAISGFIGYIFLASIALGLFWVVSQLIHRARLRARRSAGPIYEALSPSLTSLMYEAISLGDYSKVLRLYWRQLLATAGLGRSCTPDFCERSELPPLIADYQADVINRAMFFDQQKAREVLESRGILPV